MRSLIKGMLFFSLALLCLSCTVAEKPADQTPTRMEFSTIQNGTATLTPAPPATATSIITPVPTQTPTPSLQPTVMYRMDELFPDNNFEEVVLRNLVLIGVKPDGNGTISSSDLEKLEEIAFSRLKAPKLIIKDISGIETLTGLRTVAISHGEISDLTPLAKLEKLTVLRLDYQNIDNIDALTGLTQLKVLSLQENKVSDPSPLAGMEQLEQLSLISNQICDISALASLTHLRTLYFSDNQVEDLSPLNNLVMLEDLRFTMNKVSDISVMANLINLKYFHAIDNQISDVAALAKLPKLETVQLGGNLITDATPIQPLIDKGIVFLERNPLNPP